MNAPIPHIINVRLLNDTQAEARVQFPDGERRYRFDLEVLEGICTVEAEHAFPREVGPYPDIYGQVLAQVHELHGKLLAS